MIKWKRLYMALNRRREEMDISWRRLGRDNSLTASAFTRMSKGLPLSAANLVKVLQIIDPHTPFDVYYK